MFALDEQDFTFGKSLTLMQNDRTLIQDLKNKDEHALALLYDKYSGAIYSVILKMIRDEGKAQNLLQDTFMTVWNKAENYGENQVMVKFKDYGFFMPLDAKGEVVVNGKAFITETPVDELRHYAEDAGKSKEEIEAITEPKLEYRFEADGVLLKTE